MSANIVHGEPVTPEHRRYLTERGRLGELARLEAAAPDPDDFDESDEDEAVDYSGWTKAQMVEELSKRELDFSGNKAVLQERLEQDDERRREEAEADEDDTP